MSPNLAENLGVVNDDGDIVVVSRSKGKNVVVMSLKEYNSIQESLYLNKSTANRKRLEKAMKNMKEGKYLKNGLIEK
jgi:antitoxin YefM